MKYVPIVLILFLLNCQSREDKCRGSILNLQSPSREEAGNKIYNFGDTNGFQEITDSLTWTKYAPGRAKVFSLRWWKDSTQKSHSCKVKEGIIKTPKYEACLTLIKNNHPVITEVDTSEFAEYQLRTYDVNRKQIGRLLFALWIFDSDGSGVRKTTLSTGRIDCDSTIHLSHDGEHEVYRITEAGEFKLIKKQVE